MTEIEFLQFLVGFLIGYIFLGPMVRELWK